METVKALEAVVGADHVSTSDAICESYSYSPFLGKMWVTKPEIVVIASTTDQVSKVVDIANRYRVPLTPRGAVGWGGHGGPLEGGILLDLSPMDGILSIDVQNMKAVAEAGCSFFKLSHELYKQGLMLPTTEYGPGPNVAASAITPVNAFGKTRYGRNIDLVEGFEVVLPTGEIVRVGSMAYYDTEFGPFFRYVTGPDLIGLFTQSNGAFGIITKVAYRCLKRPKHWNFSCWYWPLSKVDDVTEVLMATTALETFDVHINDHWRFAAAARLGLMPSPEDCYFIVFLTSNAETEQELRARVNTLGEVCKTHGGTELPGFGEQFFTAWPTNLCGMAHPGASQMLEMTDYGFFHIYDSLNYPTSYFSEVYIRLMETAKKHRIWGFPRLTVFDGFPMKSQVMCSQTWAMVDVYDESWLGQVRGFREEFREWFGKKGGTFQSQLPPLVPQFAWSNQAGHFELLKRIKRALDPNDILSPGTFK